MKKLSVDVVQQMFTADITVFKSGKGDYGNYTVWSVKEDRMLLLVGENIKISDNKNYLHYRASSKAYKRGFHVYVKDAEGDWYETETQV